MIYRRMVCATAVVGGLMLALPVFGLEPEDTQAFPFPPGEHAALVKEVCADCHEAGLVLGQRYDQEKAERYYSLMVGGDPASEEGRKIVQYLTTVLGD